MDNSSENMGNQSEKLKLSSNSKMAWHLPEIHKYKLWESTNVTKHGIFVDGTQMNGSFPPTGS